MTHSLGNVYNCTTVSHLQRAVIGYNSAVGRRNAKCQKMPQKCQILQKKPFFQFEKQIKVSKVGENEILQIKFADKTFFMQRIRSSKRLILLIFQRESQFEILNEIFQRNSNFNFAHNFLSISHSGGGIHCSGS